MSELKIIFLSNDEAIKLSSEKSLSNKCRADKLLPIVSAAKIVNCFLSWCSKRRFKTDFYFLENRFVNRRITNEKMLSQVSCPKKMPVQKLFFCRVRNVEVITGNKVFPVTKCLSRKKCVCRKLSREMKCEKCVRGFVKKFLSPDCMKKICQLPATR